MHEYELSGALPGPNAWIAREHGFLSSVTSASYAQRNFGIDIQKTYDKKRLAVYEDFDTGDYTHCELGKKHGAAVATVYRWLQERREGKAPSHRFRMTSPDPTQR